MRHLRLRGMVGADMSATKEIPHTVPMVRKAMEIVRAIAQSREGDALTVKALAADTRTSPVTCYRILRSLMAGDWIRSVPGGGHEIAGGLLGLVREARGFEGLVMASRPVLAQLADKTLLTVKVSVRQEERALTVCRFVSPGETAISVREWTSFPLAYGSSGAVLMGRMTAGEVGDLLERMPGECWKNQTRAEVLSRIRFLRRNGYCTDSGSFNPGYATISVPVEDRRRVCLAALTAIGFSGEIPRSAHRRLVAELQASARRIAERMEASS